MPLLFLPPLDWDWVLNLTLTFLLFKVLDLLLNLNRADSLSLFDSVFESESEFVSALLNNVDYMSDMPSLWELLSDESIGVFWD